MNRKGRLPRPRNGSGTPQRRFTPRSELHLPNSGEASRGFAGLAPHFGRSSKSPFRRTLFRGGRLPFHHQAQRALDNRKSIGTKGARCQPVSLWKFVQKILQETSGSLGRQSSGNFGWGPKKSWHHPKPVAGPYWVSKSRMNACPPVPLRRSAFIVIYSY
jgi:hypothetical protein